MSDGMISRHKREDKVIDLNERIASLASLMEVLTFVVAKVQNLQKYKKAFDQ